MDANIPKEIQEKLEIIQKEADFSQKMKAPRRFSLLVGLLMVVSAASMFFSDEKNNILTVLYLALGFMYIAGYFVFKKLYELHSNACDIINFYRKREEIHKSTT